MAEATHYTGYTTVVIKGAIVSFRTRRCSGESSEEYPSYYQITVDANFDPDTDRLNITPRPHGDPGEREYMKVFHDTALALFEPGNDTPTNWDALANLASTIALYTFLWKGYSFDESFTTIINPEVDATTDTYEFTYLPCEIGTRRYSFPFNGEPEETMHNDPANADCKDSVDGQTIVSKEPCIEFYGPPAKCVDGKPELTRYRVCLVGGLLKQTYVQTDTIS